MVASTLVGAVYGGLTGLETRGSAVIAGLIGAIHGFAIGSAVAFIEGFLTRTKPGPTLEQAPFLVRLLTKGLVYGLVIGIVQVGDEIVITWSLAEGRVDARPLACFFAIKRALDEAGSASMREFGVAPRLRAALHAGQVIVGEVAESKRRIVFHGDVMNTTSRLEQMPGEFDRRALVSAEALTRLQGTERYALEAVGMYTLRGRQGAMRMYAGG